MTEGGPNVAFVEVDDGVPIHVQDLGDGLGLFGLPTGMFAFDRWAQRVQFATLCDIQPLNEVRL